jgi:excisionase family DNA binding protein
VGTNAASAARPDASTASRMLTVRETADWLGVHPHTVYRMIRRGELAAARIGTGKHYGVLVSELNRIDRADYARTGRKGPRRRAV